MDKILFEKSIRKINNKSIKEYFLKLMQLKPFIIKIVLLTCLIPIIMSLCFVLREYMLKYHNDMIVLNPGIAFSGAKDWPSAAVFAIQLIPSIISFILIFFIYDWYLYIFLIFLSIGGFCNVIDRLLPDWKDNKWNYQQVVDYIKTSTSVFNLPDSFVVGGSVGLGVGVVIKMVLIFKEEKNEKNNK